MNECVKVKISVCISYSVLLIVAIKVRPKWRTAITVALDFLKCFSNVSQIAKFNVSKYRDGRSATERERERETFER